MPPRRPPGSLTATGIHSIAVTRDDAMRRTFGLALCVVALAGCQLYWLKPGADMTGFTNDHQSCVKAAGSPVGDDRLLVNLDMYKACLKSRGWEARDRQQHGQSARLLPWPRERGTGPAGRGPEAAPHHGAQVSQ